MLRYHVRVVEAAWALAEQLLCLCPRSQPRPRLPLSYPGLAAAITLNFSYCYSASQKSQKICCKAWRPQKLCFQLSGGEYTRGREEGRSKATCLLQAHVLSTLETSARWTPGGETAFLPVKGIGGQNSRAGVMWFLELGPGLQLRLLSAAWCWEFADAVSASCSHL